MIFYNRLLTEISKSIVTQSLVCFWDLRMTELELIGAEVKSFNMTLFPRTLFLYREHRPGSWNFIRPQKNIEENMYMKECLPT